MKKLFIFAISALFAACGTTPEAIIVGELENTKDQMVYIKEKVDGEMIVTDSTAMVNGKFTLKLSNSYPRQVVLGFENNDRIYTNIIVEEGTHKIVGDIRKFRTAEHSGTLITDKTAVFDLKHKELKDKIMAINTEYGSITTKKYSKKEVAEKRAALKAKYDVLGAELQEHIDAEIAANSDNIYGLSLAIQAPQRNYNNVAEIIGKLSIDNMPKSQMLDDLLAKEKRLSAVKDGAVAPEFAIPTPDDSELNLSRLKGKVVLLDFWASWCGPCRAENPNVLKIHEKYRDNGFEILGVSIDTDKTSWLKAIYDDKLTWLQGSTLTGWTCEIAQLYGVSSIPHTVIIGKDGKIVATDLRGEELAAKIDELMAE